MSRFRWANTVACLLAAALTLTPVAAQTRPGEKQHSLSGQIVDGLSSRPVIDVELALSTAKWESAADPVTPDSQGRFVFHGLPPGDYVLSAARPDFGTIYFGELPDPGEIKTIHIGPDDEGKAVVFRLIPRSSVSGVVRDELGDPVVAASVSLSRPVWNDGRVTLQQVSQGTTDDRGQFKIDNVVQGVYVVCAIANFGGSAAAPSSSHVDFLSQSAPRYYARSCGSSLRIVPAQRATADLTIASTSAVRVHGRILNGLPNLGVNLRLVREDLEYASGQFWPANVDLPKGTFEFHAVPPGNYRLEADVNGKTSQGEKVALAARLPIRVGNEDLGEIELPLDPAGEIEVVLHAAEENKLEAGAVSLGLRSATQELLASPAEDGSLRFSSLPPGVYWLLTRSQDTMCVQSAKLGTQEVLHGKVAVTSAMAARLDVAVSKRCGVINGRAMSDEQPVPDAKVLLLLSGSAKNPGDLVTTFTDDRGEFSFPGLPFGRYQLWAWSVDESGSFVGPVNLAGEEKHAITVTVSSDEPVKVDLLLLKPEDQAK